MPAILCFVNHYYDRDGPFKGKSTIQRPDARRAVVQRAIGALRASALDGLDVKVCGIPGHSLVDLDVPLSNLPDPRHLIFASIERMATQFSAYDYVLNIEDDILVPEQTIVNAILFDLSATLTEVLHPNRIERHDHRTDCVDLRAMPGWTTQRRTFQGHRLAVALNPTSGFMFLSAAQFSYARSQADLSSRSLIIGDFMASAYCNALAPFTLWRSFDDLGFHNVEHLDHWQDPNQGTSC